MTVTEAFGRYCIAGMTKEGKWIRPVQVPSIFPHDNDLFWFANQITFNGEMIQMGGIIHKTGYPPDTFKYPKRTEDFITNKLQKVEHLHIINL